MSRSAYLPLPADRYEPCVRTIRFRGLDLRGIPLRAQVRLRPDTPGDPLVDLQTVTNGMAEGLRVTDFLMDGIVPVTVVEMVINETTMEALPYAGELGDAAVLAWDMQATIAARKRKLVGGEFVVLAGVTGADAAPSDRPAGCGSRGRWSTWSQATLNVSSETIEVSLAGIDQLDVLMGQLFAAKSGELQRIVDRGLLYGVDDRLEQRLFAAEATELAFSDKFYRIGYDQMPIDGFPGWEVYNGPAQIDGRGMLVSGNFAAALNQPSEGDVTVIVDADMPALDGTSKVLASYVGSDLTSNVNINRQDSGTYSMQLIRPGEATLFVPGPYDPSARRMRVAFSIGAHATRVSFAGGDILRIDADRPAELLRLWLGRLSVGNGNPLNGRIVRAATYPYAVSDETLRAMSGGPVTDDEITSLIDEKIRTHDNDDRAHMLDVLRQQEELADSKTGLWSIVAGDTFAGADGSALGNSETGGVPWQQNGVFRSGGRAKQSGSAMASAWLNSANADGQVEADLYPGTNEASLYARLNSALTQWLLLQRSADGGITLNLQFAGQTIRLASPVYRVVTAGERYKIRFIGPRIWVLRLLNGTEELLFDVTEARLMTETIHGIRLNGGGSADNFRVLKREAI